MTCPLTSCLIWGGSYTASGLPIDSNRIARVDDSPRTGGGIHGSLAQHPSE